MRFKLNTASRLRQQLGLVLSSPPKIPLRLLMTIPFVVQVVGIVSLVGYLSYRSGEYAVKVLVEELMIEIGDRVDQYLDNYLGRAQEINQSSSL